MTDLSHLGPPRELRFRRLIRALPWLAFACCLLATLVLWAYMLYAQRTRIQLQTSTVARQAQFQLDRALSQRMNSVQYLVNEWPQRFYGRSGRYRSRLLELTTYLPGLTNMLLFDEEGESLATVSNTASNVTPPPGALRPGEGPLRDALSALTNDGMPRILYDLDWIPARCVPICWPLCDPVGAPGGYLITVLDLEGFARAYLSEPGMLDAFHFAILRNGQQRPLYEHGNFNKLMTSRFGVRLPLGSTGGTWSLALAPSPQYLWRQRIPGLSVLPVLTVLISLVVALLMRALPKREDALWRSEQRLRQTIDLLPHLIYARDATGRFLLANQAFANFLGKELDEMLDTPLHQLHANLDETVSFDAADRLALEQGVPSETADQILTDLSGVQRHFQIARHPVTLWDTGVRCVMGVAVDVTARYLEERELETYRTQLEELVRAGTRELEEAQGELLRREKLATLGRLMATVSHELRNPLGTIATSLYTIRRAIADAGLHTAERAAERAERNVHRCGRIIEELLDFARSRAPQYSEVDFDAWLLQVLEEYALPDGITLSTDLHAPTRVAMDTDRMQRCVINLLDNAVHALCETEESPAVSCNAIAVSSGVEEAFVVLRIADNGPGIEESEREHVFEPLYSTRSFGVGLGLPIVRQTVEQHAGRVWLEATPGGGTTAVMRIPLGHPEQTA